MTAKVLIFDLETAPLQAWTWGLRDQNIGIEQVIHDQYCLMWAAKWLGSSEVMHDSIFDHKNHFIKNRRCDKLIAKSLRKLMDEADILVTQNGDHFDIKWAQQLFLKHDIPPPSKFYSVDLLKESRKSYYSISHKLDFRGRQLHLGSKVPHQGFRLWIGCMEGDEDSWAQMIKYCKQDVRLTEKYYLKLRPRMKMHPNVNMFRYAPMSGKMRCPVCASTNVAKSGYNYYSAGRRPRILCHACGHRSSLGGKIDSTSRVALKPE